MLIETWIAVLIVVCAFIAFFVSLFGWIVESEHCEKERKRSTDLAEENKLLRELISEFKSRINFLELQLELEKYKQIDNADAEGSEGAA